MVYVDDSLYVRMCQICRETHIVSKVCSTIILHGEILHLYAFVDAGKDVSSSHTYMFHCMAS